MQSVQCLPGIRYVRCLQPSDVAETRPRIWKTFPAIYNIYLLQILYIIITRRTHTCGICRYVYIPIQYTYTHNRGIDHKYLRRRHTRKVLGAENGSLRETSLCQGHIWCIMVLIQENNGLS